MTCKVNKILQQSNKSQLFYYLASVKLIDIISMFISIKVIIITEPIVIYLFLYIYRFVKTALSHLKNNTRKIQFHLLYQKEISSKTEI
jgi:hypothetical protein